VSYESMSDVGRQVCEYVEIYYRQQWLQNRSGQSQIDYTEEIQRRREELPEAARIAVTAFLAPPIGSSMGHSIWKRLDWGIWQQQHLRLHQKDQKGFWDLEQNFGNQEVTNVDWQMAEHKI
jgi:hypothetical protein